MLLCVVSVRIMSLCSSLCDIPVTTCGGNIQRFMLISNLINHVLKRCLINMLLFNTLDDSMLYDFLNFVLTLVRICKLWLN